MTVSREIEGKVPPTEITALQIYSVPAFGGTTVARVEPVGMPALFIHAANDHSAAWSNALDVKLPQLASAQ